ncbi:hypothetical protein AAE02nite_32100 [Adhaeribacter aerolatus]|uniref:Uncharacterized protein n=1 Tax=Adhaeribacter aerolatus TaxID=670289 RepID=A0A512B0Q9_9BACT|nr:hypothetical protein [Adhaeribacter aerolatus]GEO05546.1 hypothetical protein AAE02nite_32100 [Adhaeribacter aerolatus]
MFHKNLYLLFFLLLLITGCQESEVTPTAPKDLIPYEHLLLGNPSQATPDEVNANNFLLQKPQYTLS